MNLQLVNLQPGNGPPGPETCNKGDPGNSYGSRGDPFLWNHPGNHSKQLHYKENNTINPYFPDIIKSDVGCQDYKQPKKVEGERYGGTLTLSVLIE